MSNIFITSETIDQARSTLPPAHLSSRDVIEVKVMAEDGNPAMVEFERVPSQTGNRTPAWSWEAMLCWKA